MEETQVHGNARAKNRWRLTPTRLERQRLKGEVKRRLKEEEQGRPQTRARRSEVSQTPAGQILTTRADRILRQQRRWEESLLQLVQKLARILRDRRQPRSTITSLWRETILLFSAHCGHTPSSHHGRREHGSGRRTATEMAGSEPPVTGSSPLP